jgi:hypothetical protein
VSGESLIDEIVRDGARRMLAAALEAEVAAYIDAHVGERDEHGRRLVVRNGHAVPRQVLTSAGAVQVCAPRVNDKRVDEVSGERRRCRGSELGRVNARRDVPGRIRTRGSPPVPGRAGRAW